MYAWVPKPHYALRPSDIFYQTQYGTYNNSTNLENCKDFLFIYLLPYFFLDLQIINPAVGEADVMRARTS